MNDRIRELAEQAWDSTRDEIGSFVDDGGEVNWDFLHTYDKKFAELIVKECMLVCRARADNPASGSSFRDGALLCRQDIRRHFGVRE